MSLKGIIFDLGGTLMFSSPNLNTAVVKRMERLSSYISTYFPLPPDAPFASDFLSEYAAARQSALETSIEVPFIVTLKEVLARYSTVALSDEYAHEFFAYELTCWQPFPEASSVLHQLVENGFRLALLSNAPDSQLVSDLASGFGFAECLAPIYSSACLGWRKPMKQPFLKIALEWNLSNSEVVVVGDSLSFDLMGARNADMRCILTTEATHGVISDDYTSHDVVISHISELVHTLDIID